jgi:hypothetical protein
LDNHLELMISRTAKAAAEIGFFQRMRDLISIDKIPKFSLRLTSQACLQPSLLGLTNVHLADTAQVSRQGLAATVHFLRLHDDEC